MLHHMQVLGSISQFSSNLTQHAENWKIKRKVSNQVKHVVFI